MVGRLSGVAAVWLRRRLTCWCPPSVLQTPAIVIAFLQPGPGGKPPQPGKDAQVSVMYRCLAAQ